MKTIVLFEKNCPSNSNWKFKHIHYKARLPKTFVEEEYCNSKIIWRSRWCYWGPQNNIVMSPVNCSRRNNTSSCRLCWLLAYFGNPVYFLYPLKFYGFSWFICGEDKFKTTKRMLVRVGDTNFTLKSLIITQKALPSYWCLSLRLLKLQGTWAFEIWNVCKQKLLKYYENSEISREKNKLNGLGNQQKRLTCHGRAGINHTILVDDTKIHHNHLPYNEKKNSINNNDLKFINQFVLERRNSIFWPLLDFTLINNPI